MSSPLKVNPKSVATTQSSTDSDFDTATIVPPRNEPPQLPPLHSAAQRGDLHALQNLLFPDPPTQPSANATDRDAQNITALHWAAINNQLLACKLLLDNGAEVDAKGGELDATPLHWASRNGYVGIVHLLLSYNADPTLTDSQSFNALHLAVHSSSALLVSYYLFTSQPLAVDTVDAQGHTSLSWACYQGDALSVDLLLRAGADPNKADEGGLTCLHWAVVKGNSGCIKRILEAGGDVRRKENQGKTPLDLSRELKSEAAYYRALRDAGLDEQGRKRSRPLTDRNTKLAIFLLPSFFLFLIFYTLNLLPWWTALPSAAGEAYAMHHVIVKVLLDVDKSAYNGGDRLIKSPYLAGLVSGSVFWVGYVWLTRLVSMSTEFAIANFIFGISILLCAYNLFRAMTLDPGFVPEPANDAALKDDIEKLVVEGRYDGQNFCLGCLIRKPLRSKHCRVCDRCVARHDHHCPWTWSCIGVNNHRQFLLFILFLIVGIISFDHLIITYYSLYAPEWEPENGGFDSSCIMPTPLCTASNYDAFALAVAFWATLQLTWTLLLLSAQLYQVATQMTTLEVSNLGRYGYMGGRGGTSMTPQSSHSHSAHSHLSSLSDSNVPPIHSHVHGRGGFRVLLTLLGLDRFTRGKATEGLVKSKNAANPFDAGFYRNCLDFWTRGRELGIDYTKVYDVPPGGFAAAKAMKIRMSQGRSEPAFGRTKLTRGDYTLIPNNAVQLEDV